MSDRVAKREGQMASMRRNWLCFKALLGRKIASSGLTSCFIVQLGQRAFQRVVKQSEGTEIENFDEICNCIG